MYQVLAGDKAEYRQSIEPLNTTPPPPTTTNGKQNKMVGLRPDLLIITLNINGQNIPTKRKKLAE